MNYYEELGVGQDATEQEIRKAHRRLVKLMHPDAQPDQNLKMLAETQMRRLNSIVSTLLDSEQRRTYDEELIAAEQPTQKSFVPALRGIPWWLASAVGAVVLTLAAVWVWADHMGNGSGNKTKSAYSTGSTVISPQIPDQAASQASYTPPPPIRVLPDSNVSDQPQTNPSVSTAVVPAVPVDLKPADPKPVEPKIEAKKTPPPVIQKPVIVDPPKPPIKAVVEKQKVLVPPPTKIPDAKTVVAQQHKDVKPVPPPVKVPPAVKQAPVPVAVAKSTPPPTPAPVQTPTPAPKKTFVMTQGNVIARANGPAKSGSPQLLPPPAIAQTGHDYNPPAGVYSSLPAAAPPPRVTVPTTTTGAGIAMMNPRDPLEGEWVYAPKEPEKRKSGFYPPEFIDLKLFGAGDPGNLRGQYNAKYVVTDRPVAPEVSFDLASVSRGSRKFVWQSSNGAKGTLSIDPIDERTIRIDWHTTSAVRGPALTSGTATLVRRQ